jgi:hypothetical protein
VKRPRLDRARLKRTSARRRPSKLRIADEARPHRRGARFASFLESLPSTLGAADLLTAIEATARAHARGRTLLWGFGAHVRRRGLARWWWIC